MRIRLVLVSLLLLVSVAALTQTASADKKPTPTGARKKTSTPRKQAAQKQGPSRERRATRLQQTFVASSDLKPMAAQLLDSHSQPAYGGVEAYARRHDGEDAGALAWLVLGYAYLTDNQPPSAIPALIRAQKPAGELSDYADFLLAQAQQAAGDQEAAARTLRSFAQKYPKSLLLTDAALVQANALIVLGEGSHAAAVLESRRTPARGDLELALGRAYLKTGNNAKALESFRQIYFTMPMSDQALDAYAQLQQLAGSNVPAAPYEQRRRRAELLYQARQYAASATEYRALLDSAPSGDLRALQVAYGTALYKSGKYRDARLVLEQVPDAPDEINAQRLFYLAEMSKDDGKRWLSLVNQLRDTNSSSGWLSEALLAAGNRALLKKDYKTALAFYNETWLRNPEGQYASYTHWKAAWLSYRLGKKADAAKLFEEQITKYGGGTEAAGALYWRGRMAEDDGELGNAKAYYQKLASRYRLFYYGALGTERLRSLSYDGPPVRDAVLARVQPVQVPAFLKAPPADNVRVQKAMVLENGALYDFAIRELQAAGTDPLATYWAQARIARIYQSQGRSYRALQVMKRAVPQYYSYDFGQMPRAYWEVLFPRLYWPDLEKYSANNSLDPYLVAALIRQESEFNPSAISRANAMGLMQLLPSVGKKVAKHLKLRGYNTSQLTVPEVNLQLGSTYFRQMLDEHDGQVEYALAAYNAGGNRVEDWRGENYRDIAEFVESIPFTETRDYVQAIHRNAVIYRRLYAVAPTETARSSAP